MKMKVRRPVCGSDGIGGILQAFGRNRTIATASDREAIEHSQGHVVFLKGFYAKL